MVIRSHSLLPKTNETLINVDAIVALIVNLTQKDIEVPLTFNGNRIIVL